VGFATRTRDSPEASHMKGNESEIQNKDCKFLEACVAQHDYYEEEAE
jgi:hypothetical protein